MLVYVALGPTVNSVCQMLKVHSALLSVSFELTWGTQS